MKLSQHITMPRICRFRGTVIHETWPQVVFFAVYTSAIVCAHNYYGGGFKNNFPLTLVPVMGFVTGLLLVFRTNTAYDRYWEGRKLWSQITHNTRVLIRLVWATMPENKTEDLIEKLPMINLIVAFSYAVKDYLRGNYSYEAEDLRDLIAHLPRVVPLGYNALKEPQNAANGGGKVNGGYDVDAPPPVVINGGAHNGPHLEVGISFPSKSQSSWRAHHTRGLKIDKWIAHASPTETNIPMEIILYLTSFVNMLTTKEKPLSDGFTRPMTASLTELTVARSGLERILQTPIPLAYAAHLEHTLWLYLLALPFQLMGQLHWWTIPAVTVIAFAMLGILDIRIGN